MPRRPQPPSLRQASLRSIVRHFAEITSTLFDDSGQSDVFTPFQTLSDDMIEEIIDMLDNTGRPPHLYLKLLLHANIRCLELRVNGDNNRQIYFLKTLGARCQKLTKLNLNMMIEDSWSTGSSFNPLCELFANMPLLTSLDVGETLLNAEVIRVISEKCPKLLDLTGYGCGLHGTDLLYLCNSPTHTKTLPKLQKLSLSRLQDEPSADTIVKLLQSHPSLLNLCISDYIDQAFELMYGEEFQSLTNVPPEWIYKLLDMKISGGYCGKFKLSEVDRLNLTFQCCPGLTKLHWVDVVDPESLNNLSRLKQLKQLQVSLHPSTATNHKEKFSTHMFPLLTDVGKNLISLECSGFDEVRLMIIGKLCPILESLNLPQCEFAPEHDLMEDYAITPFLCFTELNVIHISPRASSHSLIDNQALSLLLQNATRITEIILSNVSNLTDTTICASHDKHGFRDLKRWQLTNCSPVSVESIWKLLSADNPLKNLSVNGCENITVDNMNRVKYEAEKEQFIIDIPI